MLGGLLLGGLLYALSGNDDRAVSNSDNQDDELLEYYSILSNAEEKMAEQEAFKQVFQCGICHGTGKCDNCNGTGEIWERQFMWLSGTYELQRMPCPVCVRPGVCKQCDGTGKIDSRGNSVKD